MKNRYGLYILGLVAMFLLLGHVTGLTPSRLLQEIEYKLYDARLRTTLTGEVDPRIVVIDIDEGSLAEHGGWPWPRDKLAELTEILFEEYKIEVLGYDVVFPEPDDDAIAAQLRGLVAGSEFEDEVDFLLTQGSRDRQFAGAMARHNVVLGYGFDQNFSAESVGELPPPVLTDVESNNTGAPRARRHTANLPMLQSAAGGGFFSLLGNVDSDGIIRKVSLLNKFKGNLYESLSLAVARNYLGVDVAPIMVNYEGSYTGLEGLDLGFSQVTIDNNAAVYVPFQGPSGSFRYIPARDVLNRSVSSGEELEGVIALVGTSAAGLVDLRATPVQNIYPGVEVHANVVAGILDDSFIRQPAWILAVEVLTLIALGLLLTFLMPHLSALWMTLLALVAGVGLTWANLYFWTDSGFVLPLANSLLLIVFIYIFNMIYGFFSEAKSRQELTSTFGMYVPPEIVGEMRGKSGAELLASEKRDMTVLFIDVRDFTPIAEALDPEVLTHFMNSFLTPLTEIVHDYRGAIDKYMGDAMMSFWGAPLEDPEHALHGVQAALAMSKRLVDLNKEFEARDWPQISVGIGLGTGQVSVGNMGSEFRMAYTVLGDAVNLGSRLEGLTKFYGVQIVIGESTVEQVPDYVFRELDFVRVKGKHEPIRIYEPLGTEEEIDQAVLDELSAADEALRLFRSQDWDGAEQAFMNLDSTYEHPLYSLYLERIEYYRAEPPGPDWDGVFVYKVK